MTQEQIEAITEMIKDFQGMIDNAFEAKTLSAVNFYNGSCLADFNKNKKILEDMIKEENK